MDQSEENRKKDIVKRFVAACEDPSHEHKLQLHHRKNRKDHLASMRKGSIKTVSSKKHDSNYYCNCMRNSCPVALELAVSLLEAVCNSCRKKHTDKLKNEWAWLCDSELVADDDEPVLEFSRYDFSEPQFGKDVCDRIISPLKGAIRRYCDEGHDILSTSDMYVALQARPVTGTTAAVCELNRRAINDFKLNRVNSFSTFHNFMYEAEGLRISKAYNIGTGNLIPWSELNIQGQCLITLDELDGQCK
ncbi:hypothetical protein QZH41_011295, partial [Actinostola sp. cb2023]